MVGTPNEWTSDGVPRRLFLRVAAATGAVAGISSTAFAQQGGIELVGSAGGWVGASPAQINGEQNPTLQLRAGETYTLTWTNGDGASHNVVISDDAGSTLERTEIVDTEGETQTLEFEATEEMSTYYCEVHPDSMRGSIETGSNAATGQDAPAELPVSEAFSAGRLAGDQGPNPVETSASGATLVGLGEDGSELHYVLLVADIEGVTQAHIHLGGEDEAGDVVAWLFGRQNDQGAFVEPLETGISGSGVLAEGSIASDDLVGPLEGESLETLLEELRAGTAYVNVHTEANPGGEIRGQLAPADAVNVEFTERVNASVTQGETMQVETQVSLDVSDSSTGTAGSNSNANADGGSMGESEGDIDITYDGTVAPGNTVTITATAGGEPVVGGAVEAEDGNGDRRPAGRTDENGQSAVTVPASGDEAGELSVRVRDGEREGELEVENED